MQWIDISIEQELVFMFFVLVREIRDLQLMNNFRMSNPVGSHVHCKISCVADPAMSSRLILDGESIGAYVVGL